MDKDFLQSLKHRGFTARIKRLGDTMLYDSKKYYLNSDLDIEPNFHIVFLLLKEEKELTVTEIAKRLKFSHPAIIKITKKMKVKGYLESLPDASDNRKTILRLSNKGLKQLPIFEKEWNAFGEVIKEVVDESFLRKLAKIENRLYDQSICERYFNKYSK